MIKKVSSTFGFGYAALEVKIMRNKVKILLIFILLLISCFTMPDEVEETYLKKDYTKLVEFLYNKDFRVRNIAIKYLEKIEPEKFLDLFLYALETPYDDSFKKILNLIENIKNEKIKNFYLKKLKDDQYSLIRKKNILKKLYIYLEDEKIYNKLQALLKNKNNALALQAAELLSKKRDPIAHDVVKKMIFSDFYIFQREALRIIGNFGYFNDIKLLEKYINDPDPFKRQYASESIEKIKQYSKDTSTINKSTIERRMYLVGKPKLSKDEFVARRDVNGRICAAIKIISSMDGFAYDSYNGIVGDIDDKPGVDVVYLSPDERVLIIYHVGYDEPLKIILSEVGITLKPKQVWIIKIKG